MPNTVHAGVGRGGGGGHSLENHVMTLWASDIWTKLKLKLLCAVTIQTTDLMAVI